jgi:hypothetical protein
MAKRSRSRRARASGARADQAPEVDFATEYHYVLSDLKRFALLAVAMFALLIILAFALPPL